MYDWINYTYNTVKGKCPHDCHYCFMKKWGEQPALHFDEKELKTGLGKSNFIFVGSSCDLFAKAISEKWITDTIAAITPTECQKIFITIKSSLKNETSLIKIPNKNKHVKSKAKNR